METFFEKFKVRWSDLDANKHVGNSSYMVYCAQTRMAYLDKVGFGMDTLMKYNLAPVILKEDFIFYKEIYASQTIYVSLEVTSTSKDGNIFGFTHKLYDEKTGTHHATSKVIGVWIDLTLRKRTPLPDYLKNNFLKASDSNNIEYLTIEDIKTDEKPVSIDPDFFIKNYKNA